VATEIPDRTTRERTLAALDLRSEAAQETDLARQLGQLRVASPVLTEWSERALAGCAFAGGAGAFASESKGLSPATRQCLRVLDACARNAAHREDWYALRRALEHDDDVPPVAWTCALLGLRHDTGRLDAHAILRSLLDRDGVAPPRGYLAVWMALDDARAAELSRRALERAVRAHEPGAHEIFDNARLREAWRAASGSLSDKRHALSILGGT
jgi:hypothetical protein